MKCIEILISEHQAILQVLKILEKNIHNEKPDVPLMEDMLRFVVRYVDEFHHYKEEEFLFTWMISHDSDLKMGPVARMQQEHQLGRSMIRRANDFVQKLKHNFNQETYIELCDCLELFIIPIAV